MVHITHIHRWQAMTHVAFQTNGADKCYLIRRENSEDYGGWTGVTKYVGLKPDTEE